jgi:hypothetical protein
VGSFNEQSWLFLLLKYLLLFLPFFKVKIVANSNGNGWNGLNTNARISKYGLKATSNVGYGKHVFATKGYPISGEQCREENFQFPGTIIFYYEVTITSAG